MPLQSSLWFAPVDPTVVPTPAPGYFALFISNGAGPTDVGRVYKKDSAGLISSVSGDEDAVIYTDEMARDAVGTILQNSGSVALTYNDDLNFITAAVIDASIATNHLVDQAVTTAKLMDAAVITAKIADNAVTADKLSDFSVGNAEIAPAAVTASKIADGSVSNVKIVDGSVTNSKLDAGAVTGSKLADNSVSNLKIADAAVSNSKIAPLAVTSSNLADSTVTNAKLATGAVGTTNVIDASITTAKLADAAVTTLKLTDLNVTTAKVADAAVTTTKLADLNVTTAKVADAAITAAKLGTDAVTQVKIADAAVGTAELVDGSVTPAKLATDAVTNIKIADAAVGTAELIDGSVTAVKLGTDAVTNIKIADAAVNTAELVDGAVTAAKLATDAVTQVKIADAAVGTAELVDGNVTNAKLAPMGQATFKMRAAGAGTGAAIDGTAVQAKTALAITATDVSGLGTAATQPSTAFEVAGAAAAAQAAAIAASQPLDADLTAMAALTTTAYGRALLTLTDAAAATSAFNTATTALKGLMSAADKTKLDALNVATSKLRYTVTDSGITTSNTGAANVTAWNALMASIPDNCEVYFPPGPSPYPFAGTLAIPTGKHLKIAGASNQKSIIQIQSATADIFTVGDWYNEFNGLKFTSSVTRTAGAAINSGNNVAVNVYNCDFAGMWDGIAYVGGVNSGNLAVIENCGFTATLNRGITIDGANANTIIDKVVMDGQIGVQQVGLELLQAGSVLVSNSDFIRAVNNLRFNPVTPNGVFSAYFTNTFFDTSSASSVKFANTGNTQRVKFTNCWFSGSVTGCEFASTAATLPTAIDFINCDIFGNSSRGIYANGVQDFSVSNCRIAGNTVAGIETNASAGAVTKFNVTNNSVCPTAGFGANGTGILINAGTYGGYAIKNNDVRNNTTNNLLDSGTVATTDLKIIGDNFGHLITGSIGNIAAPVNIGGSSEAVILAVRVPAKASVIGQVFRFRAIGVASGSTVAFRVRVGTTGTTSDAQAWLSTTSGTLSTNNRAGFDGTLTVRAAGASGSVQCEALGFANATLLPTTTATVASAGVNTVNPWFITLTVATGLGGGFAAQQAVAEAL